MSGLMTRLPLVGQVALALLVAGSVPAQAQALIGNASGPVRQIAAAVTQGDLHGTVLDDRGAPLAGAMISAVGAISAFAVSERDGSFSFRNLPAGPYLLRAHLQGYVPTRGRIIQINASSKNVSSISLTRRADGARDEPQVLEAGLGTSATAGEVAMPKADDPDAGELAWRLRHLKRSVLKDADLQTFVDDADPVFLEDIVAGAGNRGAFGASGWLGLALNGQINLLTRTTFDRPEDLFSPGADAPRGVTYVALSAPTLGGDWAMRGAMTQGDISSWILSGAYLRRAEAAHQYEAGLSYGTQRYRGGNAAALAAVSEGTRNVGAVYAYDNWTVNPRLDVSYGAKYARYDYLADRGLLSPRAAVRITPLAGSSFQVHASASRREIAPGAEEFLPPSTGLWLPPERTFSPIRSRGTLRSERVDHFEVSTERRWVGEFNIGVRAFRENVDDQIVTMFGVAAPDMASANVGHYFVASGGDFNASGWGISVHRAVLDKVLRATVDYSLTRAEWSGASSADRSTLNRVAPSAVRSDVERVHDLTASVESELESTATRFVVVYKINSSFANGDGSADRGPGSRYQVQVNQGLPFLNFSSAQWEMLVMVRNLFSDDFRDGSVYDELLVVKPPTRVVGGLTVRF